MRIHIFFGYSVRMDKQTFLTRIQEKGKVDTTKMPTSGASVWRYSRGHIEYLDDDCFVRIYRIDTINPPMNTVDVLFVDWSISGSGVEELPDAWLTSRIDELPTVPPLTVRVTFDSVPIDAMVYIDSKGFKAECFNGSTLSCSEDAVHQHLIKKSVSREWWDLTVAQRKDLGKYIIRDFVPFYQLSSCGAGDPNCAGGTISWRSISCVGNAIIRYTRMHSTHLYSKLKNIYYKYNGETKCLYAFYDDCFWLPCYTVGVDKVGFGHEICALQIGEDITDFDSWVFFQYGDDDIKPGNRQMPYGVDVTIEDIYNLDSCHGLGANTIAGWHIDDEHNIRQLGGLLRAKKRTVSMLERSLLTSYETISDYLGSLLGDPRYKISDYKIKEEKIIIYVKKLMPAQNVIPKRIASKDIFIVELLKIS